MLAIRVGEFHEHANFENRSNNERGGVSRPTTQFQVVRTLDHPDKTDFTAKPTALLKFRNTPPVVLQHSHQVRAASPQESAPHWTWRLSASLFNRHANGVHAGVRGRGKTTSCFVARISNPGERFGKPFYEVDVPSPLRNGAVITSPFRPVSRARVGQRSSMLSSSRFYDFALHDFAKSDWAKSWRAKSSKPKPIHRSAGKSGSDHGPAPNTTAHLVAEFARIQIEVPSEFWRIQLRMDQRCAVVLSRYSTSRQRRWG